MQALNLQPHAVLLAACCDDIQYVGFEFCFRSPMSTVLLDHSPSDINAEQLERVTSAWLSLLCQLRQSPVSFLILSAERFGWKLLNEAIQNNPDSNAQLGQKS